MLLATPLPCVVQLWTVCFAFVLVVKHLDRIAIAPSEGRALLMPIFKVVLRKKPLRP